MFGVEFCKILTLSGLKILQSDLKSHEQNFQPTQSQKIVKIGPKNVQSRVNVQRNIVLHIAYDGTRFLGWQKTASGPSVESSLELVCEKVLQEKIVLQAASRTDRGVHAEGQIVNFFTTNTMDLGLIRRGLNALLPKTIRILLTQEANLEFHPTLQAEEKEYWYEACLNPVQLPFHRKTSWHYPKSVCIETMRTSCHFLIGLHDFTSFSTDPQPKNPVCHLAKIEIIALPENRLRFILVGNRFLYKMARTLVGTLLQIGSGKIEGSRLPSILNDRQRKRAGVTAPALGLKLHQVFYAYSK